MSKNRVPIDYAVGSQPYIDIVEKSDPKTGVFSYEVSITKPNGKPLMPTVKVDNPMDSSSVAYVTAQAMAKLDTLAYGYNNQPYLWEDPRWVNVDDWMRALSHSMHGLIRTGLLTGKSAKCFYTLMHATWQSLCKEPMALKPFGKARGFPVQEGVIFVDDAGNEKFAFHEPANENLHFLPVGAMDVFKEYIKLLNGERDDSLLMRFLRSSLNEDQITTLRRWFGLHLMAHEVGNPEKMLYMWGPGGNGKGVIVGLLRGLVTDDAVATLRLKDLRTPSNLELLIGKLAMVGAEGSPETDNELLKTIVSWEHLTVNPKYRDPFELQPTCLVTQASNPPPHFDDDSDAMVRRVIVLHMAHQPSPEERVVGIAQKVLETEYPLLVAFALRGAVEVARAGTIEVPASVAEYSRGIVRPVRPVDRFFGLLEFGHFEVADDELYEAFRLMCVKQRLPQLPPAEFVSELVVRLERAGKPFLRRQKVTGYPPQVHVNDRSERAFLVPQLAATNDTRLFFGLRIAEGPYGPPIGQPIPPTRRGLPVFS